MGEVWEARHTQLDATVAIKFAVERRASDPAFVARFRREACAMARLRSPDIVQVFDAGVFEGQPFLVMELLQGETLRSRLERSERWGLTPASAVAQQMARALSVIHREGMVHRDVTPGNIFLLEQTPEFPELRTKLLDFGIAKKMASESRITTSGALVGSPAYMSPEQARSEALGAPSDLWSLGAVLFRTITGEDAFQGKSLTEVLFAICTGDIPRPTQVNPELPAELDGFFGRAFARNPTLRFGSALEMGTAFFQIAIRHAPVGDLIESSHSLGFGRARVPELRSTTETMVDEGPARTPRAWQRITGRVAVVGVALGLGVLLGAFSSVRRQPTAAMAPASAPEHAVVQSPHSGGGGIRDATVAKELVAPEAPATGNPPGQSSLPPRVIRMPGRLTPLPAPSVKRSIPQVDPVFGLPVEEK